MSSLSSNINIIQSFDEIQDKLDIEYANLSICYNNIKNIPLKRYKLINDIYNIEYYKDRSILGWELNDTKHIFPKSTKQKQFYCHKTFIDSIDSYGFPIKKPEYIDIIPDFKYLDDDQIYKSLYGATQKIIQDKEALEQQTQQQASTISTLQNQLSHLTSWATTQGYIAPQ